MDRNEYHEFTFAKEIKPRPKHKPSKFNFKTVVIILKLSVACAVTYEVWSRLL